MEVFEGLIPCIVLEMKECLKTIYRNVNVKSGESVKVAREAGLTTEVRV